MRGSLVAPVRRERPWARFHKHNHPPKRSHCHIRQTLDNSTRGKPGRGSFGQKTPCFRMSIPGISDGSMRARPRARPGHGGPGGHRERAGAAPTVRCHCVMRSGFSPSDEDEAGGARECHG